MGRKPSKLQAVKIPWDVYKEVKDQALRNDTTIKSILVEYVEEQPKQIAQIEEANDELEEELSKLRKENRNLKKRKEQLINKNSKLKKQSGGKWEDYEEVSREDLKEGIQENIPGVGQGTASKLMKGLHEELKFIVSKGFYEDNE